MSLTDRINRKPRPTCACQSEKGHSTWCPDRPQRFTFAKVLTPSLGGNN